MCSSDLTYLAGGGGGGAHPPGGPTGIGAVGGIGGGGNGTQADLYANNAIQGTGGGGGGGGHLSGGGNQGFGGAGASGILILKHSATQPKIATFLASGTFTAQSATVNYLVVGGGGAGSSSGGAGGGAGGYLTGTGFSVTPGSQYAITVGAGGAAGVGTPAPPYIGVGSNGTSSSFSSFTSLGGGAASEIGRAHV